MLSVLYILLVPLLVGMFVRKFIDFKGQSLIDDYLCGFLALIVVSGIIQFVTITFDFTFDWYSRGVLVTSLSMAFLGLILSYTLHTFSASDFSKSIRERIKAANHSGKSFSTVALLIIVGLIMVRVIFSTPVVEGDFTFETINTTLSTNTIYKYNSLTGVQITGGMPLRQQILTLPFFLGFLAKTFNLSVNSLLYVEFPCFVAVLALLVFHRFADYIYPTNYEKRMTMLHILCLMLLVGDCGPKSPTFLLVYQGFTGYCILACVIMPYVFYACLRRKWGISLLCVAAEAFLVWTTYGIGFSVIMIAIFALCLFISKYLIKTQQDKKGGA